MQEDTAISQPLAVVAPGAVRSRRRFAFEIDVGQSGHRDAVGQHIALQPRRARQNQNRAILGNVNNDDGDRNFSKGSLVTNRLDILTEFDSVWQKTYGVRVSSAALWYDNAYNSLDNRTPSPPTRWSMACPWRAAVAVHQALPRGSVGGMARCIRRSPTSTRGHAAQRQGGPHTVYWGDSLLLGGAIHGVSYAQNSLDLRKGFATPGAEAKELFRPKGGITLQTQAPRTGRSPPSGSTTGRRSA